MTDEEITEFIDQRMREAYKKLQDIIIVDWIEDMMNNTVPFGSSESLSEEDHDA